MNEGTPALKFSSIYTVLNHNHDVSEPKFKKVMHALTLTRKCHGLIIHYGISKPLKVQKNQVVAKYTVLYYTILKCTSGLLLTTALVASHMCMYMKHVHACDHVHVAMVL